MISLKNPIQYLYIHIKKRFLLFKYKYYLKIDDLFKYMIIFETAVFVNSAGSM